MARISLRYCLISYKVGIADLLASAIALEDKCSLSEARKNIWLVDSKGLISGARTDHLAEHKLAYVHNLKVIPEGHGLMAAIKAVKPTALIGGDLGFNFQCCNLRCRCFYSRRSIFKRGLRGDGGYE